MKTLKIVFPLFLCLINLDIYAQEVWNLDVNKKGVRIYTRPMPDSKINALRVEFDMVATPAQLVAVLMDVPKSPQWLFHCKSSEVIKKVSPREIYCYTIVDVPWPFQDRDFVSHVTVSPNLQTKTIVVDGPAIQGMIPEKKGTVRITQSSSRWTIAPSAAPNTIHVIYELEVEPAGSVPSWLINLFASKGPMETLEKLKFQINKPDYKKVTTNW